jgi:cytochrome oxidase Cu insertion factor (SCO1/SenC/PrrC family)
MVPMATRPSSIAWLLCFLAVFIVFALYASQSKQKAVSDSSPSIALSGDLGGAFELTDHNGQKVTEKSWPNKYLLLYFGFTHCPDVCPTGLNKIVQALNELPEETVAQIQPILVTIDPSRDTASSLKTYVELFHPKLVGLTGTQQQVDHIIDIYKVYAQKEGNGPDYMMNHSAYTYLQNPNGQVIGIYAHDTPPDNMAKQISQALNK